MAASFSNAKIISTFVVDRLSFVASRRGYAAVTEALQASASSGGGRGGGNVMIKKGGRGESSKTNSWIPDPVTGYYRPENRNSELLDAADLRRILLKNKN